MKILMVCLGNICRSPLAHGIMEAKIRQRDLNWEVDSAGTGSWHIGKPPDPRSIAIGRKYHLDISGQRARQFSARDFMHYDLILVMDSSNYRNVIKLTSHPKDEKKVKMIMNFVEPGYNQGIPDPYYDDDGFERVYRMLEEACNKVIEYYR